LSADIFIDIPDRHRNCTRQHIGILTHGITNTQLQFPLVTSLNNEIAEYQSWQQNAKRNTQNADLS